MIQKCTIPRLMMAGGTENSDIRYLTGLEAPDAFGVLVCGSTVHLLVSALEAARAAKSCPKARLTTPENLFSSRRKRPGWPGMVAVWIKGMGMHEVRVGSGFPYGIVCILKQEGIEVDLDPDPPFPRRAIKTSLEIRYIRESQHAAADAMRAAMEMIRQAVPDRKGLLKLQGKPLTSERIRLQIGQVLARCNCSDDGTIVAPGPQGALPHETGSGPVYAGQPVVMDIFPRNRRTGYWGDMTRTVVRGRAPAEVQRMHRDVRKAQQLAFSMLRPGVASRSVQMAVEKFFREAGHITRLSPPGQECGFIHSLGHGVGLDIHESPGLRNEPGRLKAGHVVTVEPGLYVPGLGGVRIEDTVRIVPGGYKILATCSRIMEL